MASGKRKQSDSVEDEGGGDGETAEAMPLYARFLSLCCYEHKAACGGESENTEAIAGRLLWDRFLAFAKRNHHKVQMNASEFAERLTWFACLDSSGMHKYRKHHQLVFSVQWAQVQECLRENHLLDEDVW